MLLAVERRDRRLRFFVGVHLDEPEAFASAGVAIVDDLSRHDLAVSAEQLFELGAIDAVGKIAHVQLFTHWLSPGNG
jgi:hypothetical protein